MNQRTESRSPRKLTVLLGDRVPALCADVGPGGLCVQMARVFLPGSRVHGSVLVDQRRFPFAGEVAWARPGDLRRRSLSRVGIRFLEAPPDLLALLAAGKRTVRLARSGGERVVVRRRRAA